MIRAAILVIFLSLPSLSKGAETEELRFYSGIDMHYCNTTGGCYTSSFGYEWVPVKMNLVDSSYSYWTGQAEMHRKFRGKNYTANVFVEEWREPYSRNRITVTIAEDGHPESSSRLTFWTDSLHDFIRFDLEGMESMAEEGPQRPILAFGPEYQPAL